VRMNHHGKLHVARQAAIGGARVGTSAKLAGILARLMPGNRGYYKGRKPKRLIHSSASVVA
jgi:hypothetical protein